MKYVRKGNLKPKTVSLPRKKNKTHSQIIREVIKKWGKVYKKSSVEQRIVTYN